MIEWVFTIYHIPRHQWILVLNSVHSDPFISPCIHLCLYLWLAMYIHVYTYIYIYIHTHIHAGMYIYIYTVYTRNAWALPRRCSVEVPHSQSNVVATLHSVGRINKDIREYWNPTPVKLYIQLGRSTKALGNIKIPPRLNSTFNWEDQQRY